MIVPVAGSIAIEPILRSELEAARVKKSSGILLGKPGNRLYEFEGVPNCGRIISLPPKYDGTLKVGDRVVHSELKPKGYKLDGQKFFIIELDKIGGVFND